MAATEMTWSFQVRTQMAASSPSSTPTPTDSEQRRAHQQQRRPQPREDQRQHGAGVAEGVAEVEDQDVLDVEAELDEHRLVEAEALAQLLDVLERRAAGLAREHGGRIAGRELQQQEVQHHDAQDDGHRLQQAPDHIAQQPRTAHWLLVIPVLVTGIHRTSKLRRSCDAPDPGAHGSGMTNLQGGDRRTSSATPARRRRSWCRGRAGW